MRKTLATIAALLLAAAAGRAQNTGFAVSTNLVDAIASFTLDLDGQFTMSRNFSGEADFKKTIYGKKNNQYQTIDQFSVAAGMRWWPWYSLSGWFVGGGLMYEYGQSFNVSTVNSKNHSVGVYAKGGHSFMLLQHLNVDLGIALWAGGRYGADKMEYGDDFKQVATLRPFAGVADVIVAIVYVF